MGLRCVFVILIILIIQAINCENLVKDANLTQVPLGEFYLPEVPLSEAHHTEVSLSEVHADVKMQTETSMKQSSSLHGEDPIEINRSLNEVTANGETLIVFSTTASDLAPSSLNTNSYSNGEIRTKEKDSTLEIGFVSKPPLANEAIMFNVYKHGFENDNFSAIFDQPTPKNKSNKTHSSNKVNKNEDLTIDAREELVAEHRLVKDLFKHYNKDIRPSERNGEITYVFLELSLFDILKLDTKDQILKTNTELILKWIDFHLKWDPAKYDNITIIRIPYSSIWNPDVILYNTADSDYSASILNTNVIVRNTGEVELVSHAIFISVCNVDIQWYPFDQQECKMTFAPWSYDEGQIHLILGPADISDFNQNPEFYLENFSSEQMDSFNPCCQYPMSTIVFHIQLQRRTKFSLFFYIMPGILINLCAVMVFSLPAESGEKIGLGINSLLAMIVFLMAMTENLPPTQKIPLAGVYYGVCLSVITANIALSVFVLNINFAGERAKTSPMWLRYWTVQLTKILGNRIPDVIKEKWGLDENKEFMHGTLVRPFNQKEDMVIKLQSSRDKLHSNKARKTSVEEYGMLKDPFQRRAVHALEAIAKLTLQQEERLKKKMERIHLITEWKFISRVIDRFLFISFAIVTFIFNIAILTSSPYGEKFEYCPLGDGECKGMSEAEIMALAYKLAKESITSHNKG